MTGIACIEDAWDLWTTKEGIESWWGPDGFAVKVRKLDLRPGGELHNAMTAISRLVLTFDAMHDEQWTQRAAMGWENELDKLAKVLKR